jgi:hypothetical protein
LPRTTEADHLLLPNPRLVRKMRGKLSELHRSRKIHKGRENTFLRRKSNERIEWKELKSPALGLGVTSPARTSREFRQTEPKIATTPPCILAFFDLDTSSRICFIAMPSTAKKLPSTLRFGDDISQSFEFISSFIGQFMRRSHVVASTRANSTRMHVASLGSRAHSTRMHVASLGSRAHSTRMHVASPKHPSQHS